LSQALESDLSRIRQGLPPGKSGWLTAGISTTGVEVRVTTQRPWWRFDAGVTGYAGRLWGGQGWQAGARATLAW